MEFCSKCGTRLTALPSQPRTLVCSRCGFRKSSDYKCDPSARFTKTVACENIVVIGETKDVLIQPAVRAECPRCSGKKAYCRTIEVGEEEEAIEIQVFKCTQCGHTWREKG